MISRRWRRLVVAGAIVVALVASCGSDSRAFDEANLRAATYGVEADGCSLVPRFGSAGLATAELIFTSAHVVAGSTELTVHDADGATTPADLVALDIDLDIALLRLRDDQQTAERSPPLTYGDADPPTEGRLLTWSPGGRAEVKPVRITKRLLVTIEDIYTEDIVERRAIEIEGSVSPGDSGGAVVDDEGLLVGLVYAASRQREVGFAVRTEELQAVLDRVAATPIDSGRCAP